MSDRRDARILALQALCQMEVLEDSFREQLDDFLADEEASQRTQDYARELVNDTWSNLLEIDTGIQEVADNWNVKRMAAVDRNILRMALCEILHRADVPPAVSVNEAVEIAKAFGTQESPAFINGILDAFIRRHQTADRTGGVDEPSPSP